MKLLELVRRKPDPVAQIAEAAEVCWIALHSGVPNARNESPHPDYRRIAVPRSELFACTWHERRYVFAAPREWAYRRILYLGAWDEEIGGQVLSACLLGDSGLAPPQEGDIVTVNDIR